MFGGAAFLAVVLGVTSLTYLHTTIRALVLYLVAMAALVFGLGVPQEFARQLYLPESLDKFLVLWLLAVVPLTLKRLWALEVRTLPTRGRTCQSRFWDARGLSSHKAAE